MCCCIFRIFALFAFLLVSQSLPKNFPMAARHRQLHSIRQLRRELACAGPRQCDNGRFTRDAVAMQSLKLRRIESFGESGYRKITDGFVRLRPVAEIDDSIMIAADEAEDLLRCDQSQPRSLFDGQSPKVFSVAVAPGQLSFERAQPLFVHRSVERA